MNLSYSLYLYLMALLNNVSYKEYLEIERKRLEKQLAEMPSIGTFTSFIMDFYSFSSAKATCAVINFIGLCVALIYVLSQYIEPPSFVLLIPFLFGQSILFLIGSFLKHKYKRHVSTLQQSHPHLKSGWSFPVLPKGYDFAQVTLFTSGQLTLEFFGQKGVFSKVPKIYSHEIGVVQCKCNWPWTDDFQPEAKDWRQIGFRYEQGFDQYCPPERLYLSWFGHPSESESTITANESTITAKKIGLQS